MDDNDTNGALSDPDRLLTQKEVEALTGISGRRFEEFRQYGGGPKFLRFGARTVRYRAAELKVWIEAHAADSQITMNTQQRVDNRHS